MWREEGGKDEWRREEKDGGKVLGNKGRRRRRRRRRRRGKVKEKERLK